MATEPESGPGGTEPRDSLLLTTQPAGNERIEPRNPEPVCNVTWKQPPQDTSASLPPLHADLDDLGAVTQQADRRSNRKYSAICTGLNCVDTASNSHLATERAQLPPTAVTDFRCVRWNPGRGSDLRGLEQPG
jgi:hypothetical protein